MGNFARLAVSAGAAALLAGCGGSPLPMSASGAMAQANSMTPSSYRVLYNFAGSPDGRNPLASLIVMKDVLYGTTARGGKSAREAFQDGTVFTISTTGTERLLHSFGLPLTHGKQPVAGLVDMGGTLYGTTERGGMHNTQYASGGTVFSISLSGRARVLHSFRYDNNSDGVFPEAGLIALNGTLYGTTSRGGTYGYGTVFSLTPDGTEKVLHSFGKGIDGEVPQASLINVRGTLYGTTAYGGSKSGCGFYKGCGTVFSITPAGTEKILHAFGTGYDGARPVAALIAVSGRLYGTTAGGGAYGDGTVFSMTTSGSERVLSSFGHGSHGAVPEGSLIDVGGTLYGTTNRGGTYNDGTIFSITTSGRERVLHDFGNASDGAFPQASLVDVAGTLYGTTSGGGTLKYGTVFAVTP